MTFIDLSDAEGMLGLFIDLVEDERAECQDDPERLRFVEWLLAELKTMEVGLDQVPRAAIVHKLRSLQRSADRRFALDPVMVHLDDLTEAIENVSG